ncbi:MAG TPA: hypothetical protein VMV20_03185, partial [Chitinophagaceae bacterium]|nr:hypothetical protein [Chitinophagaceae bacterium]
MIPEIRDRFLTQFTPERYAAFQDGLENAFPGALAFRVAETPVFIPRVLTKKILEAGTEVLNLIRRPDFREITAQAIPPSLKVSGDEGHCPFIALDFAICKDDQDELVPRLIELQGFPTLLAFQSLLAKEYRRHFQIPENLNNYFSGLDEPSYFAMLQRILLGGHDPAEVVLLEVNPQEQKTRIDFYCTESATGIRTLNVTDLIGEGHRLFYMRDGVKTPVRRIYNRVIFDDLARQHKQLGPIIDLTSNWEVEWVPHPNWFFRISKYTLPFLQGPFVPTTYFLKQMEIVPRDLENYVLKPLFSFAGQGVMLEVTRQDIDGIKNPEGWILQQKVRYADVVRTPAVPAKCELRMIYFWENPNEEPVPVHNLGRLSKGKMIGVRYNADQDWV